MSKQDSQLMTLLGAGLGAGVGGMAGAAGGASLGGMLGGMASPDQQVNAPNVQAMGPSGALQRRMIELNDAPLKTISDSINSLKYVQDPAQRAELAKTLLQAQYMAQNQGQV